MIRMGTGSGRHGRCRLGCYLCVEKHRGPWPPSRPRRHTCCWLFLKLGEGAERGMGTGMREVGRLGMYCGLVIGRGSESWEN